MQSNWCLQPEAGMRWHEPELMGCFSTSLAASPAGSKHLEATTNTLSHIWRGSTPIRKIRLLWLCKAFCRSLPLSACRES